MMMTTREVEISTMSNFGEEHNRLENMKVHLGQHSNRFLGNL